MLATKSRTTHTFVEQTERMKGKQKARLGWRLDADLRVFHFVIRNKRQRWWWYFTVNALTISRRI